MIIGVDIKALKHGNAGIARYLRSVLDELAELDRESTYYLFTPQFVHNLPTADNFKQIVKPSRLPGSIWLQLVVPGLLKKYCCNLLWAPEQCAPVWLPSDIPVVATIHDMAPKACPETMKWSTLLFQKLFLSRLVNKAKLIIAVSEYTKHEIAKWYPASSNNKIIVAPNGGPKWKDPVAHERKDFLLVVGSLEPRKNIINLLKALVMLSEKGVPISLRIVGPSGWKNEIVHQFIRTNKMEDCVELLGFQSEDTLEELYLTCNALVFPSIYEGFGLPVLEAIARGTPVLTSMDTVMEEICGDLATYFDPFSPSSIAECIIGSITDPIKMDYSICKDKIHQYSWHTSANIHLSCFKSLVTA